jgi:hypothetical protein
MDIFSVDLTLPELQVLRQSLDIITLTGKDAKFIASLQSKLEHEIIQVAEMQSQAAQQKQLELQRVLQAEEKKAKKAEASDKA